MIQTKMNLQGNGIPQEGSWKFFYQYRLYQYFGELLGIIVRVYP